MRSSGLKVGLLSALIACAAFTAAKAQEDDKSYLPPKAFQGKAEPSIPKAAQNEPNRTASNQPQRMHAAVAQPQRKRVRLAHRRHYERYAYNQPFPRFFFGLFN